MCRSLDSSTPKYWGLSRKLINKFNKKYILFVLFSLQGNKGGALFCNDEFTGILSNGISCGAVNQPGVFTQVRFFDDWINQQFLRTDIPAAGSIPFGP